MAISKEKKNNVLKKLKDLISSSKITIFVEYKGTNVEKDRYIRSKMREKNVHMFVAKKTLIQKIINDMGIDFNFKSVKKPIAVVAGGEDEYTAAKLIANNSKEVPTLVFFGGILDKRFLSKDEIISISTMPSKEESISKLLFLFTYPIRGFMTIVNEISKKN